MLRAILGLIKGFVVGGAVGYGLFRLGWTAGVWAYLASALVGAVVGVVCGRAPWKSETIWTPVVKMVIGAVIGAGLAALGRRFLPDLHLASFQTMEIGTRSPAFLTAAIGVLYGMFVEIDDGGRADKEPDKLPENKAKSLPGRPR